MSRHLGLAVAASLGAATAYGVASAIQFDQAARVARRGSLAPGLLLSLARRPVWLVGITADGLAVLLQAVGLRFGPVVLVQPLLVAGLPIAVVLSALAERRRPNRRETAGLLLCSAGLVLLVPASATVDLGHPTGRLAWTVAGVCLTAVVGALLLAGHRRPALAAVTIGTSAGIAAGTASVLLAVCAVRFDHPVSLLRTAAPYAAVVVGGLALLLTQSSFQTGRIAAPLAALSVTEPAVAVLLAVTVLQERLPHSLPVLAAGLLGAALAIAGVLVLALGRTPIGSEPPP